MTSDDGWPNGSVRYEDDADEPARWQSAIDAALAAGTLHWERTPTSSIFDLVGQCPRCGHDTSQPVYFEYIVGVLPTEPTPAITNIVCDCNVEHQKQPTGKSGCGWALLPSVKLDWPANPRDPA